MPIFFNETKRDQEFILRLASHVCDFWNENGGPDHGVRLFVSKEAVRKVSEDGDQVLAAFFPEEPGPFKRVAALLVLSRLTPLFALASPTSTPSNLEPVPLGLHDEWIARICYLLVEPAFAALRVRGADGRTDLPLSEWAGFPSVHSKAEFLLLLEWLTDYPDGYFVGGVSGGSADDERLERKGRMVLAFTLILESVYYQGGDVTARNKVCSACDKTLLKTADFRHLFYDALLMDAKLRREGKEKGQPFAAYL
jgi:hypothetical protein